MVPSLQPSDKPSVSQGPSSVPSAGPSASPSVSPSVSPSASPSDVPSRLPSASPSAVPTVAAGPVAPTVPTSPPVDPGSYQPLQVVVGGVTMCLTAPADPNASTNIEVAACSAGSPNQDWYFDAVAERWEVESPAGYCLMVDNGSSANVILDPCGSNVQQKFSSVSVSGGFNIQSVWKSTKCLEADSGTNNVSAPSCLGGEVTQIFSQ